jgi:hypothetical protein
MKAVIYYIGFRRARGSQAIVVDGRKQYIRAQVVSVDDLSDALDLASPGEYEAVMNAHPYPGQWSEQDLG